MTSWDEFRLKPTASVVYRFLLFFRSRNVRKNFEKSYRDLRAKIDSVEETTRLCKLRGWSDLEVIWNASGFILTTSLDSKMLGQQLLESKSQIKIELNVKHACILIFETLDDIQHLLGKSYLESVSRLSVSDSVIDEMKARKKSLSKFRHRHKNDLEKVRTIVGAHRDHDFLLQLETLRGLEASSFFALLFQFDQLLMELAEPMQKIMNESTDNFVRKGKDKELGA